jgi:hypothetical protein
MADRTYVHLTGGLGNQLFQYAAGLYLDSESQIFLEDKTGAPRGSNKADIFNFELSNARAMPKDYKSNILLRKSLAYTLRTHANLKHQMFFVVVRKVTVILTSLICTLNFRKIIKVVPNSGIGFDSKFKKRRGNSFIIGYFQTYIWSNSGHVKDKLAKIELCRSNSFVDECRQTSKERNPLIVHVRLGDYLNEDSFGIPNVDYYRTAVNFHLSQNLYDEIWVFSDEISKAKDYLPDDIAVPVVFKDDAKSSPAQILEAMRYGKGYVLANSTFSWWAATLSYSEKCQVVAPDPWFKAGENPIELCPPHWKLINAY